jgi:hypothetical protein
MTVMAVSCKKEENKVIYEGGTAPVLTASRTTTIPLSFANKDNEALSLSWTNPNYQFNTGLSSQSVNYVIEIDKQGANFKSTNKQSIAISNGLSRSFTQGEFNDFLLNQLSLDTSALASIELRVISYLATNAVVLSSNVYKYNVIPYPIPPKVTPPATGKLFITGSATPAGWQCACGEPELIPQKFTKVTETLYELPSIQLNGDQSYLLLPKYADWGAKYGFDGANNQNNVNGDNFKAEGGDIKAPPVTGLYKISVDFQKGKFTVTKL